jgi:hypothetical protein
MIATFIEFFVLSAVTGLAIGLLLATSLRIDP